MDQRKKKALRWLNHAFQPIGIAGFFTGVFLSLSLSVEIREWLQSHKKLVVPLILFLLAVLIIVGQREWKKNKNRAVWSGNGWRPLGVGVTSLVCGISGYLEQSHLILALAVCVIMFLFDYILWPGREEVS